jgi:hypothetical protein
MVPTICFYSVLEIIFFWIQSAAYAHSALLLVPSARVLLFFLASFPTKGRVGAKGKTTLVKRRYALPLGDSIPHVRSKRWFLFTPSINIFIYFDWFQVW